jgi:hypothetical protein
MKLTLEASLVVGALVMVACVGDNAPNDDAPSAKQATDSSASPVGSEQRACGKGGLKVGTGELAFCDPNDADKSCPSTEELVGYTSVNGDISIYPGSSKDLSDASCLQTVATTLSISGGTELTSLMGLDSLEFVKGLEVLGLDKLISLSGIDKLSSVNTLTVNANEVLTDITGLPSGFTVGSLYVAGNSELVSLDGLANINVTDVIAIEKNPKLSSCKAAAFAKKFPGAKFSNFGNLSEVCN